MSKTDRAWENYGNTNPYFGVLTDPRYLGRSLDDALRTSFFDTGGEHVAEVLSTIRRTVAPDFSPAEALDFGCGVGRVALPLAAHCERVVGVDVSPSMLAEARANAEWSGIGNLELVESDDELSQVEGKFDLVHSTIVLQHIPTRRGYRILQALVERVRPGGVGVIQLTYESQHTTARKLLQLARNGVPVVQKLLNVLRRRPADVPAMQMNSYDLPRVFAILQRVGVTETFAQFTDHGGFLGATLYFRR